MQQTKRRSKKGVILLALAIALLVVAIVPAAAMAAPQQLVTSLHWTNNGVDGQGGYHWFGDGTDYGGFDVDDVHGHFHALLDGVDTGGANIHSIVYKIDGLPVNGFDLLGGYPFDEHFGFADDDFFTGGAPVTQGIHTMSSWVVETTPTANLETPVLFNMFGIDNIGPVWQHVTNLLPGSSYSVGDVFWNTAKVDFEAFASDPDGSGVKPTPEAVVYNQVTSDSTFFGRPLAWDEWTYDLTGTVDSPTSTAGYTPVTKQVDFSATDMVGNSGSSSYHVNFDRVAPHTSYTINPTGADTNLGWTNKDVTVTFHAADGAPTPNSGVAYTEFITKTSTTTVPPAAPALSDSGTQGTSLTITATAPVGPVYVWYRSVDKAIPTPNKEAWLPMMVFIDKVAPALSDDVPAWWINDGNSGQEIGKTASAWEPFWVTLTASDHNSGLAFGPLGLQWTMPTWRDLDTGLPAKYPYDEWMNYDPDNDIFLELNKATHDTDGIYPLSYRASDKAGNEATASATVKIDTMAPVTEGASGWINGTKPYMLTATDQSSGAGVAATIYRVNKATKWTEAPAATVATTVETSITLAPATQGFEFTIDFGSLDAALPYGYDDTVKPFKGVPSYNWGNSEFTTWLWSDGWHDVTGFKSRTVKLDVTAPVVTAIDPKNGNWQKGPAVVNFSGTDVGAGYAYTEWKTSGTDWTKGEVASVGGDGEITITYHGVDKVGIMSADQTIMVKVASTPPTVTGANASVKKGKKATFKFNVTSVTPTGQVTIQIRTKSGRTLSTHHYNGVPTGAGQKSFTINLKKGKYNIRIGAVDQAGNVQTKRGTGTLTVK